MTTPSTFQKLTDQPVSATLTGDERIYGVVNPTTTPSVEQIPVSVLRDWLATQSFITNIEGDIDDILADLASLTSTVGGHTTSISALVAASGFFKNLAINGDMRISQNGTSSGSVSADTFCPVDQFRFNLSSLGTWTVTQDTDVPTGYGFRNSMKFLCTTPDAAPSSSDIASVSMRFEGQDLQRIRKGTSSAQQLTVSFWVKAKITGTFAVELFDNDNSRHTCKSFSVNSAETWEKKTITFAADTTGAFDNDANYSMQLTIYFGAGSTYTVGTLPAAWAAFADANRAAGQTNLAGTINNYITITGLQVELGTTATDFEFVPLGIQLLRCWRYFYKTFPLTTAPAQNAGLTGAFRFIAGKAGALLEYATLRLPVSMRATPTVTFYNPSNTNAQARDSVAAADCSSTGVTAGVTNSDTIAIVATGNASTAVGNPLDIHLIADARL
jgi:hypothetical protein